MRSADELPTVRVRMARLDDLSDFVQHLQDHVRESGRGGSPHFSVSADVARGEVREEAEARWTRGLHEPHWGRTWLMLDEHRAIVGHLDLHGGRVAAELHRATLGMGLMRVFTGQRLGELLLDAAVTWARDEARLAWIDLGVFVGNERARRFYERAGFIATGTRVDAFRLPGDVSVDDIAMSLKL